MSTENIFSRRLNRMIEAYESETGKTVDSKFVFNRRTGAIDLLVAGTTFVLGWLLLGASIGLLMNIATEGISSVKALLAPFALFEAVTFFIAIIPTAGMSGILRAIYLYLRIRRVRKLSRFDWTILLVVNCDGGWAVLPFITVAIENAHLREVILWRAKQIRKQ